MIPPLSLLALSLVSASSPVLAALGGTFADGGQTLISAMMVRTFPFHLLTRLSIKHH